MSFEAFEKQPEAKKRHILQICIEEFAHNGYENTSTDTITRRAGISKGLLFHYFKSKKNLFMYILEYIRELLTDQSMRLLEQMKSDDFFGRIKELVAAKQQATAEYGLETRLIMDAIYRPPTAVKREIEQFVQKHHAELLQTSMVDKIYDRTLLSPEQLRDGITTDRVIQVTMLIVEQLTQKFMEKYRTEPFESLDIEPMMAELEACFDIIRHGVFKK